MTIMQGLWQIAVLTVLILIVGVILKRLVTLIAMAVLRRWSKQTLSPTSLSEKSHPSTSFVGRDDLRDYATDFFPGKRWPPRDYPEDWPEGWQNDLLLDHQQPHVHMPVSDPEFGKGTSYFDTRDDVVRDRVTDEPVNLTGAQWRSQLDVPQGVELPYVNELDSGGGMVEVPQWSLGSSGLTPTGVGFTLPAERVDKRRKIVRSYRKRNWLKGRGKR